MVPWVIITVIIAAVFNYYFEEKVILGSDISGSYKVNRIITQNNEKEIPFFGSSRCEGTFIPDMLVENGFNYGMSGTQDDVLLFFLKEECRKKKTTPVIVNFDLDGLNYSLGDMSNYIYNAGYPPVKALLGEKYETHFGIPLIRYYGHFETYTKYYLNSKSNLTKFTNKGASVEKNELPEQKMKELINERLRTKMTFHNDPELLKQFLSLIANHTNRLFILIVTPYHASNFNGFTNYTEAMDFLRQLQAFPHVKVLDFSKMDYPDRYYINTTHLNEEGAKAFNSMLRDSLKNLN